MKIYLDTANIADIQRAVDTGLISGVTTNPASMAKALNPSQSPCRTWFDQVKMICGIVKSDVSTQVTAKDADGILFEAEDLVRISEYVVIKVPATREGLIACKRLSDLDVRVNVTLVFSPIQALMAANAGAYIVSPFLARTDDARGEGSGKMLIADIADCFARYDLKTKVLAASIRTTEHVFEAMEFGADICTISPALFDRLFENELTEQGLAKFMAAWESR